MIPLCAVIFPINFVQFIAGIHEVAAFDFYETGELWEEYLKIDSTEPYNANFEELGMESTYILNNLGTLILFYVTYPLFLLMYPVLYIFRNCCNCCKTRQSKWKSKLFYNMLIVGVMESYAVLALCCIVGLQFLDFSSWGLIVQSGTCIAFSVLVVVSPILVVKFFF